jgi:hypothetical protein
MKYTLVTVGHIMVLGRQGKYNMNIIRSLKFKVKVTIYKIILRIMQSLRVYTIGEIIHNANSPEGMRWNDLLLLRVSVDKGMATVLYCKPNQFVNIATVPVDDLANGTAHLDCMPHNRKTFSAAVNTSIGIIHKIGTIDVKTMHEHIKHLPNIDNVDT